MNIFTDYYEFFRVEGKSTRYDCNIATHSHPLLESLLINRLGELTIYLVDRPINWEGALERRTGKALIKKSQNISSLYIPDPSINVAYGDIYGTNDAIIVKYDENWENISLYISRGQKNNRLNLYQLLCDGEIGDEMYDLIILAEEITQELKEKKEDQNKK